MCAKCFERNGDELGWGKGQLYARQTDGMWRLVFGFDESQKPSKKLISPELPKQNIPDPDEALRILAKNFGSDFAAMLCEVIDARVANALLQQRDSIENSRR